MATDTTITGASGTGATTGAGSGLRGNSAKEIQERFLTLLVTQMKNQDPLNPLDNAQVTSQLAQVSTVTGVENLNTTMQSVLDQMNALQYMQATTMVGRSVLVPGSTLTLGASGNVAGAITTTEAMDGGRITIRDASGATVRDIALDAAKAGTMAFEWDGMTNAGTRAAPGQYTFGVSATLAGRPLTVDALAVGQVLGVSRDASGKASLDIEGIGSRTFDQVKQVL